MSTSTHKSYGSFEMSGDWEVQAKRLQAKFPDLTNEDVYFESGKLVELVQRIESRLNLTRAAVMGEMREAQQQVSKN